MTDLDDIARECWAVSDAHGFHSTGRSFAEAIALVHSELSEALEADRKGEAFIWMNGDKPDGTGVELADAVIRLFDLFVEQAPDGVSLEGVIKRKTAYNRTRSKMHGKRY